MTLKQVLVFRKDIQMNKGKMIAQGAHAAMLCMLNSASVVQSKQILDWAFGSMAKIAVGVDTLEELNALEQKAREAGLLVYPVIDSAKAGLEIKDVPTKTCIAIGPGPSDDIDKITGHLKTI